MGQARNPTYKYKKGLFIGLKIATRPTFYCCFFLKIETMISLTMIRKCANKESAPGQTRTPFRHDEF